MAVFLFSMSLAVSIDEGYVRGLVSKYGLSEKIDRVVEMLLKYPIFDLMSIGLHTIPLIVDNVLCPFIRDGYCIIRIYALKCLGESEHVKELHAREIANRLATSLGLSCLETVDKVDRCVSVGTFSREMMYIAPTVCKIEHGEHKLQCSVFRIGDNIVATCNDGELSHLFIQNVRKRKVWCTVHQALTYELLRRYVNKIIQKN